MCCFVLLVPTPEECRVPRVNPGVTASKLFSPLLPSLATPGPPLPYRPLQKSRYYYPRFRVGSSICLASSVGCAEGAGGSPFPRSENLLSKRIWGILRNQVSFPYFRKKESIMRSRGVWDSTPLRDDLLLLNGTSGEKEVGDDGKQKKNCCRRPQRTARCGTCRPARAHANVSSCLAQSLYTRRQPSECAGGTVPVKSPGSGCWPRMR